MTNKTIPTHWTLPNRIGYNETVFKTFKPELYQPVAKNTCDRNEDDIKDSSISLFPQQQLIKDYIQVNSPYRGALLYHELGSGKSGASIAAAEGYINKKKMFVLSPASLAINYENEIYKISSIGLNLKKDWSLVKVAKTNPDVISILFDKYAISKTIIKRDGLVWIPLYENDIPNATVIKTTVSEQDKTNINLMISHIIRNRYTFISYNGLSTNIVRNLGKSPFDNSFIIIDEVHNFASRIVNGSKLARDIYTKIMNAVDCKVILLSGTPIINNPYEIATIVNLVRGYLSVYELTLTKTSKLINEEDFVKKLTDVGLYSIIDDYYIDNENKSIHLSLLPEGYKKNENQKQGGIVMSENEWKEPVDTIVNNIIKNLNEINREIKVSAKYSINLYSALPNSRDDFNNYFLNLTDEENPKIKNEDLFTRRILGTVSYYSITGSDLFPERLPDITRYLDMTDTQFKKYADVRTIERKMDNAKKGGNLFDNKSSVYRAFSRMVCNFSFPEEIERKYPNDVKKSLKKEIDEDENEELTNEKPAEKKEGVKVKDIYEHELALAIDKIISNKYLNYDYVKKNLSPKFAQMYDDINSSPGSVLVYSQFRNVEGLGLLTEFLNYNGFKQVDIKKTESGYVLSDDDIFNPRYDNKRYIIFNSDKEKTRILMNLFNSDIKSLPLEIAEKLPKDAQKNQLYGKIVKVFCITASGAEGISLKNVRRVLITEPYWNNIRIEQVIGRAIRSCSHQSLPLKDRNVGVYRYIMKFTKIQLDKDYSIKTLDKSISTDEHILTIATKKMDIINQFLKMLKTSSFDCLINAKQNKPLGNNYRCYSWAVGVNKNELAFTNNIKDDYKIMKHKKYQVFKKNKGKVIIKNGNKYVEMDGKIYNYFSYVNAGVLIEEQI